MNLPPEIAALLAQASLTDAEQNVLAQFLVANQESLSPTDAVRIAGKLGAATGSPSPPTTPATDWQAEATGMGMGVPASDPAAVWAQQHPGYTPPPPVGFPTLDFLNREDAPGPALRPPSPRDIMMAGLTPPATAPMPTPPPAQAPGAAPMPAPPTTGPGDDLAAEATPGPSGVRVSPDAGMVTPPQDFFGGARAAAIGTDGLPPTANPLPDQGGANDRRRGRDRGTDWTAEADALTTDPSSAFSGVSDEFLATVAANPDVAAQILAAQRGGGAATAAAMTPQVEGAMALSGLGLLSRGRDLNFAPPTPGLQLETAEDWLAQSSGPGQTINPASVYQRALRRANRTDPLEMDTGEGEAGSIENQIAVTHGALSAALMGSGTTEQARQGISNRLNRASQAYVVGMATGDPEIAGMSYPEYLRKVAKAQRWLGR